MDDPVQVCVARLEGVRQRAEHDTTLDKVVKLQASFGESVKFGDHHLTESLCDSEPHLIVGCVQLVAVDVARPISVVAVKHTFPLVDVGPELLELPHVNSATVISVKDT